MGTRGVNLRTLEVGEWVRTEVNQGDRDACVLAVSGAEALLEYHMPNYRTALRFVARHYDRDQDPGHPYKNVSYRRLNKHWLIKIIEGGQEWYASPQQAPDLNMTPLEFYLSRWPDEEWRLYLP